MSQVIIGLLLAMSVMLLYVWAVIDSVGTAIGGGTTVSDEMVYLLNTIGGLISATVVGALGATTTGELPAQRSLEDGMKGRALAKLAGLLPSIFIGIWIVCGVLTVVVGFKYQFAPLSSLGKTWLGTVIGAVYAYFGINAPRPGGVPGR